MASSLKSQKDKPHGGAPRLVPRPTAASAARAARIATNRNLLVSSCSKQSVNRTSTSPSKPTLALTPAKGGKSPPQTAQKLPDSQNDHPSPEVPTDLSEIVVCFEKVTMSSCVSNVSIKEDEKNTKNLELIAEDSANQESNEETLEITCDDDSQSTRKSHENSLKAESGSPNSSRPVTPAEKSRPQTPKRGSRPPSPQPPRIASRPVTPSQPNQRPPASRPVTPCHPNQRLPASRPVTPCHPNQRLPASRPVTPHHPNQRPPASWPVTPQRACAARKPALAPRRVSGTVGDQSPVNVMAEEGDLIAVFADKQRQFHVMKKELDLKQQTLLELYESLKSLHERVSSEGSPAEELQVQELVVFNVADWTTEEVTVLCREAAAAYCVDGAAEFITAIAPFDDAAITNLDQQVLELPTRFADLCLKAFTARQEVIDWVKDMLQNSNSEVGGGEAVNRIAVYNTQGLDFCETLRELKSFSDVAVESLAKLSRRAVLERRALVAVGEKLTREVARLDEEVAQLKENSLQRTDLPSDMETMRLELEEERAGKAQAKEKTASAESQLRVARQRLAKMDRQLREAEASIVALTGTVKTLEDQSRQKEVQLEAKARKLRESLKTGEMTNNQIVQQRSALQIEVQDLKDQITNMTNEHKAVALDLNKTIKELNVSLEEQICVIQKERDMRAATDEALGNCQLLVEELKAKIHHLQITKPNPDLPTEKEMALWSELQAIKETLRATEEEVSACKLEKIRFLETLTKIGDTDNNKVGMQQKLAAELVTKEEIISKMQFQLREYTKSLKLNEQKVAQYEQFTRDLIAHQRAVEANQNVHTDYPDDKQEILKLRMALVEAAHRGEELAERLGAKDQQLDQQDRTARAQARVIKVREELINLLKNKETEQGRELTCLQQDLEQRMKVVDEVNQQIAAKADEIQALFAALEGKQQQIHRLEKIVLALEEQQRRAQAQRTRHEEKIAALEHELAAGARPERKFLFF